MLIESIAIRMELCHMSIILKSLLVQVHVFSELHRWFHLKKSVSATTSTIENALLVAMSDDGPHVGVAPSRVNTDARGQTRMCIQLFLCLSLSRFAHTCTRLHHVRTHVCARRCMPEDCLPSADSQMIASDRTLFGASDGQQSASRRNQSVAGSSAEETVIRCESDKETPPR